LAKRVIIVDDDNDVRALLHNSLAAEGYAVTALATGVEVEDLLEDGTYDLALIDVGLPDIDGFTLTRRIRERFDIGIIIISGRTDLSDRMNGLDLGADDYVTKPFELKDVLARIRSVLRRQNRSRRTAETVQQNDWLRFDCWTLNIASRTLRDTAGNAVALTTGEYRLLETLARHPGRIFNRAQLLERMPDTNPPAFDRSIDVGIMRLRKKLGDGTENPRLIKTVRNGGYIFVAKVTAGN